MPSQAYEVPVVYQNNKLESMREMLDALQQLERVSNLVFDTISNRVNDQRQRLNKAQERTRVARERVQQVSSRNQATTIFSPAKYPSNLQPAALPLFQNQNLVTTVPNKITFTQPSNANKQFKLNNPLSSLDESSVLIKQPFAFDNPEDKQGLGKIPTQLQSTSGLLLFNTGESVYTNYPVEADPLLGVEQSETMQHSESGLDAPPASLSGEQSMPEFDVQPISFKPKLRDLPKLELPNQLDLPNVIDIPWELDLAVVDQPIAPSSLPIANLPVIESTPAPANGVPTPPPNAPAPPSNAPPPPPPPMTGAPPPPPPPSIGVRCIL